MESDKEEGSYYHMNFIKWGLVTRFHIQCNCLNVNATRLSPFNCAHRSLFFTLCERSQPLTISSSNTKVFLSFSCVCVLISLYTKSKIPSLFHGFDRILVRNDATIADDNKLCVHKQGERIRNQQKFFWSMSELSAATIATTMTTTDT